MLEALVLAASVAVSAADLPKPTRTGSWVLDRADVLSPADERALDARIGALERDLDVEIAVVTVPDTDVTPKEFATDLFKRWAIGKRGADNGLLVLLVRDRRRLEMETGYGLEPILPDGWLGDMQARTMVPRFKAGDYGGGLVAGLEEIDGRVRERADEARAGSGRESEPERGGGWLGWLVGLAAAGGLGWFGLRWFRQRGKCPKCKRKMLLLDEVRDDEHLTPGQRREEELGSVDYQVYICPGCQTTKIGKVSKLFTRYENCPSCRHRTLERTSETLVHATYERGGEVRVAEKCKACERNISHIERTARRSVDPGIVILPGGGWESSGGSWGSSGGGDWGGGGGGFDFGGGDSGGGGAGSSW